MATAQPVVSPRTGPSPLGLLRLHLRKWGRAHIVIGVLLMLALAFFVLYPLWELVYTAGTFSERDLRLQRDAQVGAWTWFHFAGSSPRPVSPCTSTPGSWARHRRPAPAPRGRRDRLRRLRCGLEAGGVGLSTDVRGEGGGQLSIGDEAFSEVVAL